MLFIFRKDDAISLVFFSSNRLSLSPGKSGSGSCSIERNPLQKNGLASGAREKRFSRDRLIGKVQCRVHGQ